MYPLSPPEPIDEREYDCGCTATLWGRRQDWQAGATCPDHEQDRHPAEDEMTWDDHMADRADDAWAERDF